jgi:hypothetical protein
VIFFAIHLQKLPAVFNRLKVKMTSIADVLLLRDILNIRLFKAK